MTLIIAAIVALVLCFALSTVLFGRKPKPMPDLVDESTPQRPRLLAGMPMHRRSWTIADIADFEFLLRAERTGQRDSTARRDRQIYQELVADAPADAVREQAMLFRSWLEARRFLDKDRYFGGADLVRSWKLLVTAGVLVSFVMGVGHAGGVLLLLDQNGHVSATKAALATVGVQLLGTAVALVLWGGRGMLRGSLGEFSSLRVAVVRAVLPRLVGHSRRRRFAVFLEQLADLELAYRKLVLGHIFVAVQLCVISMSLGLLSSLELYHFMSGDIRFGWSMTHDVKSETVHQRVKEVAVPWASFTTAGIPTLEQVEVSRLSRETSGRLVPADASRAWAAFLALAILTYGLALRTALLVIASTRARAAGREPVRSGPLVDELVRRMTTETAPLRLHEPPVAKPRPWWNPWARMRDVGKPKSLKVDLLSVERRGE